MVKWVFEVSFAFLVLLSHSEAASPLFLEAITSALATIPFTGEPMTAGLVGAKLGIGTKLLYYLGYFGQRSKPASAPKPSPFGSNAGGLQPFSLPNMPSGGSPNFQSSIDPAQLFHILTAQGVDPNTVMEALNYAGGLNAGFGSNAGFGANAGFGSMVSGLGSNSGFSVSGTSEGLKGLDSTIPSENVPADVEKFFTFLKDMDENTCISRLICDIGHNPDFLGDFSRNIHNMIGSLDAQSLRLASQYIEILELGKKQGQCKKRFPGCGEMSYSMVKNVAPTVQVPQIKN